MDAKPLLCPSCGGQLKLNSDMFNEKMVTCEFCGTIIDLHQEAAKQEFDINDFLKNFQNGTSTTVTTNSSTIVMKDGKIISGNSEQADDILKSVQEQLKKSGINIDGLIQQQPLQREAKTITTNTSNADSGPNPKKGFWKKMFGS
jgi:hypothetical protein